MLNEKKHRTSRFLFVSPELNNPTQARAETLRKEALKTDLLLPLEFLETLAFELVKANAPK